MRVRNYAPSKAIQSNGYRMVYVPSVSNVTQEQLARRLYTIMPDFYAVILQKKKFHWNEEEVLVIGESDSYVLFMADDKGKTAVVLAVRPSAPSYAREKINSTADRLFESLNSDYELTVRIGPNITHTYVSHLHGTA